MIFVTVGSSDPFDRLIRAIDAWAGSRGRTDIFAQIGDSTYIPQHIEAVQFLNPAQFRARVRDARLIVAHAGMGSIIAAMESGKPIIIMPKWASLGEHRNDHQVATAKRFGQKQGVIVANDEKDLVVKLERETEHTAPMVISREAPSELILTLRNFIRDSKLSDGLTPPAKPPTIPGERIHRANGFQDKVGIAAEEDSTSLRRS